LYFITKVYNYFATHLPEQAIPAAPLTQSQTIKILLVFSYIQSLNNSGYLKIKL
jgi:hypothetical protein